MKPARTSPLPAFASAELPAVLIYTSLPFVIIVPAPFKTRVQEFSSANFSAFASLDSCTEATSVPISRANSSGCGVNITSLFASLIALTPSSPIDARAFIASASSISVPPSDARSPSVSAKSPSVLSEPEPTRVAV